MYRTVPHLQKINVPGDGTLRSAIARRELDAVLSLKRKDFIFSMARQSG
jgi:hypothetical protein